MSTTPLSTDPHRRLALLEAMLRLRAGHVVPRGEEAASAGLAPALARLGPLRPLLRVARQSPWRLDSARRDTLALAADAHDVEAICSAATTLAEAIVVDGRPRLLELASSSAAAALSDDGADVEEHAGWRPVDPIALHTARLLADGVVGPGELMHLHQRVQAEVRAALRAAAAAASPRLQPA